MLLDNKDFQKEHFASNFIKKTEQKYASSLRWVMYHKWMVVVFVMALIAGTYLLNKNLSSQFFAQSDTGSVRVNIQLPTGTKLVRTARVMRDFSKQIQHMPEVETVVTQIGQSGYRTQTNEGDI